MINTCTHQFICRHSRDQTKEGKGDWAESAVQHQLPPSHIQWRCITRTWGGGGTNGALRCTGSLNTVPVLDSESGLTFKVSSCWEGLFAGIKKKKGATHTSLPADTKLAMPFCVQPAVWWTPLAHEDVVCRAFGKCQPALCVYYVWNFLQLSEQVKVEFRRS